MANFCPYCGTGLDPSACNCPSCGSGVTPTANSTAYSSPSTAGVVAGALGTLVAVTLASGITRQLYYHGGRYFLDPMCRNPFVGGRIMGPHRLLHMVAPHRPMGGPRPMGGGPKPMGGGPRPMGGGPRPGGGRGPMGGGPRGGGHGHR